MIRLDSIDSALAALRDRRPVIVVDDEDRENEGDLIMPAVTMTPEWMGFIIRHSSGVVCAPMPESRAQAFRLPPMTEVNEDAKGTAYTITCDAATGVTTGISAADRSLTVHTLAAEVPDPTAITRPGHVLPLIARDGGVRERPGHTEAGVDLCRLAGLGEVAVIAELVHDHGPMLRGDDLRVFADAHDLVLVSIEDLIAHLDARDAAGAAGAAAGQSAGQPAEQSAGQPGQDTVAEAVVTPAAEAVAAAESPAAPEVIGTTPVTLPTPHGDFLTRAWRELDSSGRPGTEHLTLEMPAGGAAAANVEVRATATAGATANAGVSSGSDDAPLVRVHSECLTGDVLGSHRCDCGEQLAASLALIAQHGGVLVYVRGHEGRGIGLWEKIRAYALQEDGADTVDANLRLGHPEDGRDYRAAAAILREMGIDRARLLTNNPAKIRALSALGVDIADRVPLETAARPQNAHYLATKRSRMQHLLTDHAAPAGTAAPASTSAAPTSGLPSSTPAHDRKAS